MYVVLVLIVIMMSMFLILDGRKPKNFPPGPKLLPIIGNYYDYCKLLKITGYHHLVWQKLSQKYGNVVGLRLGRIFVVTVFGSDVIGEIFSREEFEGRPDGFFFRLRTFGKRLGVVFSDGRLWQKQRKFSLQHLKNFGLGRREMELSIEQETRELISVLNKKCVQPIFMHQIFDVSVLNVLWVMLAGERFSVDDERLNKLLQIVHDAFKLIDMSGGLLNQMPFLRYIAPGACGYDAVMDILNRMWAFLRETISEHKKSVSDTNPRDLIEAFLQKMHYKEDETFTDDQLLSLCLDLFMAGSETTNNTLSFSVVYMLLYPAVQKKVQEEMNTVIGRNRWPNFQDRFNLPYTQAVLMEIQRISNVPPLGIAHRATKETRLLEYTIPKDTVILTSLYSIHMDKKFWKDPENFNPERFLDGNGKIVVDEKYFVPFGYGKRRCLGESLAKANLFLFFTALLHNFELKVPPEGPFPDVNGFDGVTISPKPFKALLIPRTD